MNLQTRPFNKYSFVVAISLLLGSVLMVSACADVASTCAPITLTETPYTAGIEFDDSTATFTIFTSDGRSVRANVNVQGSQLVALFDELDSPGQITSAIDTGAMVETITIEATAPYNDSSQLSYGLWVVWSTTDAEANGVTKLSLIHPTENGYTLELASWEERKSFAVATTTSRLAYLAEIDHSATGSNLSILEVSFPYYEELPARMPMIEYATSVDVRATEVRRLAYDESRQEFTMVVKAEDGFYQKLRAEGYCPVESVQDVPEE